MDATQVLGRHRDITSKEQRGHTVEQLQQVRTVAVRSILVLLIMTSNRMTSNKRRQYKVTPVSKHCNTFFMFIHLKKPDDDDHKNSSKIRNLIKPIHLPTPQRSWNNKILELGSAPMMLKEHF